MHELLLKALRSDLPDDDFFHKSFCKLVGSIQDFFLSNVVFFPPLKKMDRMIISYLSASFEFIVSLELFV